MICLDFDSILQILLLQQKVIFQIVMLAAIHKNIMQLTLNLFSCIYKTLVEPTLRYTIE